MEDWHLYICNIHLIPFFLFLYFATLMPGCLYILNAEKAMPKMISSIVWKDPFSPLHE